MADPIQEGKLSKLAHLTTAWPLVVAIFTLVIVGAQAEAKINDHEERLSHLPEITDRLARVETKIDMTDEQLDRIEHKLDNMELKNKN